MILARFGFRKAIGRVHGTGTGKSHRAGYFLNTTTQYLAEQPQEWELFQDLIFSEDSVPHDGEGVT